MSAVRLRPLVWIAAAALLASAAPGGLASERGSGRLSRTTPTVTWSGGPFYVPSSPTYGIGTTGNCRGPQDPVCDNFRLVVDAPARWWVVAATDIDERSNDFDLYVFDADGREVARSGSRGDELVAFQHEIAGARTYTVSVAPYEVTPGATYRATGKLVPRAEPQSEAPIDCGQTVPATPLLRWRR